MMAFEIGRCMAGRAFAERKLKSSVSRPPANAPGVSAGFSCPATQVLAAPVRDLGRTYARGQPLMVVVGLPIVVLGIRSVPSALS